MTSALQPTAPARPGDPAFAIETQHLRKVYGDRAVVQDLSIRVGPGEVFGFLGPNGAGKSTTVKMLLGLVYPTSGTVRVLGGSPQDPHVRRQLGFLPEQFRFQNWMTAGEFLDFHGRLAGVSVPERRRRIPEVLELVGLGGRMGDTLNGYSKGMLQRAGLAQAILHRPRLVFLDEPTSALDPIGRVEVREIIQSVQAQGTAVFLNSHLLSEVEQVCDHVAFVNRGQVLRQGNMRDLLGETLPTEVRVDAVTPELRAALAPFGPLRELNTEFGRPGLEVRLPDDAALPAVASAVLASGAQLYSLTPQRADLESLFLQLIEHAPETAGRAAGNQA